MAETRREIDTVFNTSSWDSHKEPTWYVSWRVWGTNGKDVGVGGKHFQSQDREGAILKCVAYWTKLDKRNEKRRKKKCNATATTTAC